MRGAASAVAPARADLRKVRRFIRVSHRRVLSLLAPAMPAGNRAHDLARCTRAFLYRTPSVLASPRGVAGQSGPPSGAQANQTRSSFFVAMVINEPSLHTNIRQRNLIPLGRKRSRPRRVEGNPL